MRYLLDTGIAGFYLDRRHNVFERARFESTRGNWVGIAHPVLAELVFRIEGSAHRERNLERLQVALSSWTLWPTTKEAAYVYGKIAFELRRIGRPIGQNDIMIAAIALSLGNTTVVSVNGDFAFVPGLRIENWAT